MGRPSLPVASLIVVKTLEEVTYEAGRAALADQEAMVGGIRQRTGTLLAAQALVASFLGGTAIKDYGFHALGWLAVLALLMGLVVAAVVLAPWRLKFAVMRVTFTSRCTGRRGRRRISTPCAGSQRSGSAIRISGCATRGASDGSRGCPPRSVS